MSAHDVIKEREIKIGDIIINHNEPSGITLVNKYTGKEIYFWRTATVIEIYKSKYITYYRVKDDKGIVSTIDDDDFSHGKLEVIKRFQRMQ